MPELQAQSDDDSKKTIEEAIEQLIKHHTLGAQSRAEKAKSKTSEVLRKARSVAKAFEVGDLQELTELCRRSGTALGKSHLNRLATIEPKETRMEWARRTIMEKWSRQRLDREISKHFVRDRHLGRRPPCPGSAADALAELVRLSRKLVRLGEVLGYLPASGQTKTTCKITLASLPTEVAQSARDAIGAANRLQESAEAALHAFHPPLDSGDDQAEK